MSYYIEKYKRVVTFPFTKRPEATYPTDGEVILFLTSGSSNNVSPRTYDWDVCAISQYSNWGGEIMLPVQLWQMAHDADGGGIKPHGRDVSGVNYIKSWKRAVDERFPCVRHGELLWRPNVSAWHWKSTHSDDTKYEATEINEQGVALFSPKYKHLREPLHAAFKRLFPRPLSGSNSRTTICTIEEMNDAVYLWMNREHLPTSFHLCESEYCPFLTAGRQEVQAQLLAA